MKFAIFGSALGDDFHPDNGVDVLVTFAPGMQLSFQQWLTMIAELENMLGRKVDLVERCTVEASKNYTRRKHILNHLERVHRESQ